MTPLSHIVEPERLLLTWQKPDDGQEGRIRRVVGELFLDEQGQAVFRYLHGSSDLAAAEAEGFKGFPAFRPNPATPEFHQGVVETFLRRLPPRKREDFTDYLNMHRLPSPFGYSDLALLGYTGARLPSDDFALIPQFPESTKICDYLLEVAGTRHVYGCDLSALRIGDEVRLEHDPLNAVDADAIKLVHASGPLGFVNRALLHAFNRWLDTGHITATVERLNGKPERPLIFVRIEVRPH